MLIGQALQYHRRWSRKDFKAISYVSLSSSGHWLAVAEGNSVTILDAVDGHLAVTIKSSADIATMSWISMQALISCSANGTISTISLLDQSIVIEGTVCKGHMIGEMALSSNHEYMATGHGSDIRIWQSTSGKGTCKGIHRLASPPTSHANVSADVAITSLHWLEREVDRRSTPPSQLILSYRSHGIQIWDIKTAQVIQTILNTSMTIGHTALSMDASNLAVVMPDSVDMIHVPSKRQSLVARHGSDIECPVLFIHGGTVLLTGNGRSAAQLYTLDGEKLQVVQHSSVSKLKYVTAYSDDASGIFQILTASDTKIALWQPPQPSQRPLLTTGPFDTTARAVGVSMWAGLVSVAVLAIAGIWNYGLSF